MYWQAPVALSHAAVLHTLAGHTLAAPWHAPPLHTSASVHGSLSLHTVPFMTGELVHTPLLGLHAAVWHAGAAGQITGAPPRHPPLTHVSMVLHASPSLHSVPFSSGSGMHPPVASSHICVAH